MKQYNRLYYVITVVNGFHEFHVSSKRREVKELAALSSRVPVGMPKEKWRETLTGWLQCVKDYQMQEVEI